MADDKHILTPLMDWLRAASVKESKGVTNTMVPWFLEFLVAAESAYATALLNSTFRPPPVPPEGPPNKRLRVAGGDGTHACTSRIGRSSSSRSRTDPFYSNQLGFGVGRSLIYGWNHKHCHPHFSKGSIREARFNIPASLRPQLFTTISSLV